MDQPNWDPSNIGADIFRLNGFGPKEIHINEKPTNGTSKTW